MTAQSMLICVNVSLIFIASGFVVMSIFFTNTSSYDFLYRAAEYQRFTNPANKEKVNIIQVAIYTIISLFSIVYVVGIIGLSGTVTREPLAVLIYMSLLGCLSVIKVYLKFLTSKR